MATDLLQRLRAIASSLVPDPGWVDDPDSGALLELVAELDLTEADDIEQLLPDDQPWAQPLAHALAARSMPPASTSELTSDPHDAPASAAESTHVELSPEELAVWSEAGIGRPETAQRWAEAGLEPVNAAAWYDLDLRGPEEALRWAAAGFTPSTARAWVDILDDPGLAADCVAADIPPEVAARLDRAELTAVASAAAERGVTWTELRPYMVRDIELYLALDWLEHRRRHPLDISWAIAWASRGLSPRDSIEWPAAGFRQPAVAAEWRAAGFEPDSASDWAALGIQEAASAAEAARATGSPKEYAAWTQAGVSEPALIAALRSADVRAEHLPELRTQGVDASDLRTIAKHGTADGLVAFLEHGRTVDEFCRWSRAGFGPADATEWLDHGLHAPTAAKLWLKHDFGPAEAQAWGAARFDPTTAATWIEQQFSLRDAARWASAGITSAAAARSWIDSGVTSPSVAEGWRGLGVQRPTQAKQWTDQGFSLVEATPWLEANVDAATARAVRRHRLTATSVRRFTAITGQRPEQLVKWLEHGMNLTEALAWCEVGVQTPHVARRRRQSGNPDFWRRLIDRGMTTSEAGQVAASAAADAHVALLTRSTRDDISWLRKQQVPVGDWVPWLRVCGTFETARDWIESDIELKHLEEAVTEHDLDPQALHSWTSAGFEPGHMLAAHEAGLTTPRAWRDHLRPKPEPRLVPRPDTRRPKAEPKPYVDPFDEWLEEGEEWITAVDADVRRSSDFFRMIFDEGLEWADPGDDVLGVPASDEWLGEIQERAFYVSELLRKEPNWPKVFESEEITIILDGTGDYPLAWVGAGSIGGLVCFGADEYEVYTAATNDSWRYMAGAAISWFIDCCILIRLEKKRHLPFASARRSPSGGGLARAAGRYAPRPTFAKQYDEVRRGGGTSPRAHLVDGHPRKLPPGWQPTEEARSRAPARKRRFLKANETWVSPHIRGGEFAKDLQTYLSKYSALADAMAFADQDNDA